MEKFPIIDAGNIALVRSDYKSGHILDENYDLAIKDGQVFYTIFQSLQEALYQTETILSNKPDVECTLYNSEGMVLFFFRTLNDFYNQIKL